MASKGPFQPKAFYDSMIRYFCFRLPGEGEILPKQARRYVPY